MKKIKKMVNEAKFFSRNIILAFMQLKYAFIITFIYY